MWFETTSRTRCRISKSRVPGLCVQVSDTSRAVGEGVLEAIRSKFDLADLRD